MSRSDSEKTPQRRQWTAGSSTGPGSEGGSGHRAQAWAAIGAALVGLGAVGGGSLATVGASSHLWGDDVFLAGFAFACLLVALGVYTLVGEFIGGLPLPATRQERVDRRQRAQRASTPSEGVSASAATESPRLAISAGRTTGHHREGVERSRSSDQARRRADELLRMIFEAELQAKDTPAGVNERLYYNLAASVEAWARGVGCTDDVQKFSGNVAADLPRLKVFVQTQLERWRDEQDVA
jgi:hypothetical protein